MTWNLGNFCGFIQPACLLLFESLPNSIHRFEVEEVHYNTDFTDYCLEYFKPLARFELAILDHLT